MGIDVESQATIDEALTRVKAIADTAESRIQAIVETGEAQIFARLDPLVDKLLSAAATLLDGYTVEIKISKTRG